MKVALAYSFGIESKWIRQLLHDKGISPLLIVCKGYKDKKPDRKKVARLNLTKNPTWRQFLCVG